MEAFTGHLKAVDTGHPLFTFLSSVAGSRVCNSSNILLIKTLFHSAPYWKMWFCSSNKLSYALTFTDKLIFTAITYHVSSTEDDFLSKKRKCSADGEMENVEILGERPTQCTIASPQFLKPRIEIKSFVDWETTKIFKICWFRDQQSMRKLDPFYKETLRCFNAYLILHK